MVIEKERTMVQKERIELEKFEMGASYNPFAYLNFHKPFGEGHVLKVSINMPLVPLTLRNYIDERLHPLIINTYEIINKGQKSEEQMSDVYSVDFNGECMVHSYSKEWEQGDLHEKNHSTSGFGDLLEYNEIFTEALNRFEEQMARDMISGDPRQKFVGRIKKIEGLIGKF